MSAHVWSAFGVVLMLVGLGSCTVGNLGGAMSGSVLFVGGVACLAVGEVLQQLRAIRARLEQGPPKP